MTAPPPDTNDDRVHMTLWDAYLAGFAASAEGFNGEVPEALNEHDRRHLRENFMHWRRQERAKRRKK